ncbi:histidine--tRNA ligase [Anaerosporomusa subterranea]|uniref:Histidine--tRNA ligase n=1 Tax=Anaerosporomusa subterranea TaxID=1794912 RepID=A0A154BVP0_ANASB|nr:histidine--tRNA ligase [Anaerosporomusa subterranea]KYZ77558.1 histidine--tRNA ligase [Anaerosporomusa subterranea]
MQVTGPRGTKDALPDMTPHWCRVEDIARSICDLHAYREIRTPIFEHTELFLRGIGETTDVVQKEMYTFTDRGGRSVTLRPENTAAVVRSYLENKLYSLPQPLKLFYIGPMFRYDRPQAGRLRQFHQFGIEAIGAAGPAIDAETIVMAVQFFRQLGLNELRLFVNSVGCPQCRPTYRATLQNYLRESLPHFCEDCQSRFDRNPMRILDCKVEQCQTLSQGAPAVSDCLCEECRTHFEGLKQLLTAAGIDFIHNPRLVRGLDYYTKTAFEIQYAPLGAQSAVCGGGRYDGLIEECGGQPTPGIGFAIGLERVLLALEKQQLLPAAAEQTDVFVACTGESTRTLAFSLLCRLREVGIKSDMDYLDRGLKAQFKQANRLATRFTVMIGEEEAAQGQVMLKNMLTGEQELIAPDSIEALLKAKLQGELKR